MLLKDPLGKALLDYYDHKVPSTIIVHSDVAEDDILTAKYLFRSYNQMPLIEKEAINLCKGSVLDIGACAGSHSLVLQERGLEVTALEKSTGAIKILKKRGIKNVVEQDLYQYHSPEPFDTLLLLMNGTGIAQTIKNLPIFFDKLKSLIHQGSQILVDSSDIIYMFEDEGSDLLIDYKKKYYGEVNYQMEYNGEKGEKFSWLFLGFEQLKHYANKNGLQCELIKKGDHYDYLARLSYTS